MKKQTKSLESLFRKQTVRWSAIGLLITLIFSIPCFWYASKIASEKQILVLAKSAARAFRPMILQNNIRDAQFQMQRALELKPDESAIVLDNAMKPVYPINESDKLPVCDKVMSYCWADGFLTTLYPIYFDDIRQEELFGYLQLSIKPSPDFGTIMVFTVLLIATFLGVGLGMFGALNRSARKVGSTLSEWANHLKHNPQGSLIQTFAPYSELGPMQLAVEGLHDEIEKLQIEAAKKAKADAQLSLLREISHDLKTPHALLAKYFYLHLNTIETKGAADPVEVRNIQTTLKRMGDLLRQVRIIPAVVSKEDSEVFCDLHAETETIVRDLKNLSEITDKSINLELLHETPGPLMAGISRLSYYRILENLVRNAADAVAPRLGEVSVTLTEENGCPQLLVKDNGCGIDPKIQQQIFDFDFTTKPTRGTGLGLGIVSKICNEAQAEISFTSQVGEGTCFKVTFQPAKPVSITHRLPEVSNGQI